MKIVSTLKLASVAFIACALTMATPALADDHHHNGPERHEDHGNHWGHERGHDWDHDHDWNEHFNPHPSYNVVIAPPHHFTHYVSTVPVVPHYSYYCGFPNGYFPFVGQCLMPWQQVIVYP